MRIITLALLAAVFQATVTQALGNNINYTVYPERSEELDNTNATLFSFHFLGINGTGSANNVGYLQTYNGVEYYAYKDNSLCLLTATNSSGSITKFTVSNDFGKCPDFVSGALTELTSHSDGYFLNANSNDQWHLTWFTTLDESYFSNRFSSTLIPEVAFAVQFWRTCDEILYEQAQLWGPMSYRIESCYLVKADPLDKGTPTGAYFSSQFYGNPAYQWNEEFVKSWYVIDPFPGSCPYYDNGWRTFNVRSTASDSWKKYGSFYFPSSSGQEQVNSGWEEMYPFFRNSDDGPDGQKMAAFASQTYYYSLQRSEQRIKYGCFANFLSMAAVSAALALSSFFY